MFDPIIFGEKLKNHRKALNLTQEEVAEKIGVSGQAVSKWEKGECLPDCYNLKMLGDIFGISLDILLETGSSENVQTVANKIKQLATEFIWAKMQKDDNHKELTEDLWEMWKAIYFVEIGNHELQEREMKHGMNRINGKYGAKAWDDNGIACVIKSSIKDKLDTVTDKEITIVSTLASPDYFILLRNLDCCIPTSKEELLTKTGFEVSKLNEILLYLNENYLVEYQTAYNNKVEGYKLTANRGILGYMILAMNYMLTSKRHSISEYLLS